MRFFPKKKGVKIDKTIVFSGKKSSFLNWEGSKMFMFQTLRGPSNPFSFYVTTAKTDGQPCV